MANQVVYGFHNLSDLFASRASEVGETVISEAITAALAEHNRQVNALMDIFVRPMDAGVFKTSFDSPFITRNQPLDEDGTPLPVKGAARYEVAFPIKMSGNAIGFNFVDWQKITVEEINRTVNSILMGDMRWVVDQIMAALYTNTTWDYWSRETAGLTIQPLANGDATTYQLVAGNDTVATDNHFLAQASAIADGTNPFPTIRAELEEHPENGGTGTVAVAFVPTGLMATVNALATFHAVADPNIRASANDATLVGDLGFTTPGRLRGYEDSGVWIVEYPRLPASYIPWVAVGGEKPLGQRQDPEQSLQGFVEIPPDKDMSPFPYMRRSWIRRTGFGAWNRVGGGVTRIGNGSYAIPTGYAASAQTP